MNKPQHITPPGRSLWLQLLLRRIKFLLIVAATLVGILGGCYLIAPQWLMYANTLRKATEAHVEPHKLSIDGTSWSYYEGGHGPTIVLLHSFGANKQVWLDVAKPLTAHFHVVIPDLPGWGDAAWKDGVNYNIDAQAQRLQSFVRAMGLNHFILAGHSMGGAIAGVYAAKHPEHVVALVLLDTFGLPFKANAFSRAMLADKNPYIFNNRAEFVRMQQLFFTQPPHIPGRFIDVLVDRNKKSRQFINQTYQALRSPTQALSLQHSLDQISMPVLGVWCLNDKVIDISAQTNLSDGLTHAHTINTVTLLGCNHMPMLEKPAETAQILANFTLANDAAIPSS